MEHKDPPLPPHEGFHTEDELPKSETPAEPKVIPVMPQLVYKEDPIVKENKIKKIMEEISNMFKKKTEGPIGGEERPKQKNSEKPNKISGTDLKHNLYKDPHSGTSFTTEMLSPHDPTNPLDSYINNDKE